MKKVWRCAMDLGSSKFCGVMGREEGPGSLTLLASGIVPSRGVKGGVLVDIREAAEAVKGLIDRLEAEVRFRIEGTFLTMDGAHLECLPSLKTLFLSEQGLEVQPHHVRTLLKEAQSLNLPIQRRLIHALLQGYGVDGQIGIRNPIGMFATHLLVSLRLLTGQASFLQNSVAAVNRAGLEVEGLLVSGLAASYATLTDEEKYLGTLLLDIGAETTGLFIFQEGALAHAKIFPMGGQTLTEQIATSFGLSLEEAEAVKKESGTLHLPEKARGQTLNRSLTRASLTDCLKKETVSLFEALHKELASLPTEPAGPLVFTGGGSLLEGLVEEAATYFKRSARLGKLMEVRSEKRLSILYADAIGCLSHAFLKAREEEPLSEGHPLLRWASPLRRLFADYF